MAADYDTAYPPWRDEAMELLKLKREAKRDIEVAVREAAAARLNVLDAKLHLTNLEDKISAHRKKKPIRY